MFVETAGGVTIATLKRLAENGTIGRDQRVVAYISGNGLKTTDAVEPHIGFTAEIQPKLSDLNEVIAEVV